MTPRQRIASVAIAGAILIVVLELVRRRTLRIEYSWLWIAAVAGILALVLAYPVTLAITQWIGAVSSTTTIFIFAFVFLILICIHFSVKISELANQVKKLGQELALLRAEREEREEKAERGERGRVEDR